MLPLVWTGNTKGRVSLYHWPPVGLVRNQLNDNDNFCFYLQNRLIKTSQTGGQLYSDTSPFSKIVRVLLANIRLGWKCLKATNTFFRMVKAKKKFNNTDTKAPSLCSARLIRSLSVIRTIVILPMPWIMEHFSKLHCWWPLTSNQARQSGDAGWNTPIERVEGVSSLLRP